MVPTVSFTATVAGDAASFDQAAQDAYILGFANLIQGVTPEMVTVAIAERRRLQPAASFTLITTITTPTPSVVQFQLESTTPDVLTTALGVTITSVTAPVIATTVVYPPPPAPPSPPPPVPPPLLGLALANGTSSALTNENQGEGNSASGNSGMTAVIVVLVVLVVLLAIAVFVTRKYIAGRRTTTIVKATAVTTIANPLSDISATSAVGTTSSTLDPVEVEMDESKI